MFIIRGHPNTFVNVVDSSVSFSNHRELVAFNEVATIKLSRIYVNIPNYTHDSLQVISNRTANKNMNLDQHPQHQYITDISHCMLGF